MRHGLTDMGWIPTGGGFGPTRRRIPDIRWCDKGFTFFWDGSLTISDFFCSDYYEMYDWLLTNLKGKIKIYNGTRNYHKRRIRKKSQIQDGSLLIYFRNKEDAMAFKLRWI